MSAVLSEALPAELVYLPFEAGPYKMTMGLVARDPDDIICLDEHYPDEMRQRHDLLAKWGNEVLAIEPGAEDACVEVLELLADVLPRRYPAWFDRQGETLHNRLTGESWDLRDRGHNPLDVAGRLVQEDLCILHLVDGVPFLTAGVLCFPAGWRLLEKLGHPLAMVHGPVPIYAERLARPVDRLMAQLKPGKLVERVNWGLNDNPALFRPGGHFRRERNHSVTVDNAGESVFLRVERQTLSLLPRSSAILFTIRTHVYPLARIASDPAVAARLAAAVRGLPPELHLYKSMAVFAEPALAYLDARSVQN